MPENHTTIQQLVAQHHQLAHQIRTCAVIDNLPPLLIPLTHLSPTDLQAYLTALTEEQTTDAADIAQAIYNTFSDKEARKAARRALIRLEELELYPTWNITMDGSITTTDQAATTNADTTRSAQTEHSSFSIESMLAEFDKFVKDITTTPAMEPVYALIGIWQDEEPAKSFNALAADSPLLEDLDAHAWIAHHTEWQTIAKTDLASIEYIGERERLTPDRIIVELYWSLPIQFPNTKQRPADLPTPTATLAETGRQWFWSSYLVIENDGQWKISSMADEGARLLQLTAEEIKQVIDEKTDMVLQSLEELDRAFSFLEDEDEDMDVNEDEDVDEDEDEDENVDEDEDEDDKEAAEHREATQILYYYDTLFQKAPSVDAAVYERAIRLAELLPDTERTATYLQRMALNLPQSRGYALCKLTSTYEQILQERLEDDLDNPAAEIERYQKLIEETLRQSIASDESPIGLIMLAGLLLEQDRDLNEVISLLTRAQAMTTTEKEKASIEAGLAQVAEKQERKEDALQHYLTVAQLDKTFPHLWYSIGSLQHQLGQQKEAILNLQRNIDEDPQFAEAYIELATIYGEQKQTKKALSLLQEALEATSDTVSVLATMATIYIQAGELRNARQHLERAEAYDEDEDNPYVATAQAMLREREAQKKAHKSSPSGKSQQKHSHSKHKHRK
jgi:tetratricopeptide (TPR) repeat protein